MLPIGVAVSALPLATEDRTGYQRSSRRDSLPVPDASAGAHEAVFQFSAAPSCDRAPVGGCAAMTVQTVL
ncbi:hypothetical protein [Streptomyces virginiae]|uniref:hypothetical protein n=1 Tax=Streptomyces virginiae TaxID=1961 RepID=UPI00365EB57B